MLLFGEEFKLNKVMGMLRVKRYFLLALLLIGCNGTAQIRADKVVIGVISHGDEVRSVDDYELLKEYLAKETKSIVEIEPAYNELQALEQIRRRKWSIIFATPGLAAIALENKFYRPLFPLDSVSSLERSVLIVKENSKIEKLSDLYNKKVALGQPGSAAGYYLPLYDLYGLTLAKVRFAATPEEVMQWVGSGEVDAGALSEREFELYNLQSQTKLRILQKSRFIPPGVVVIKNGVEPNLQEQIKKAMNQAPSNIMSDSGYIVDRKVPDYQEFIKLVQKVKPLEQQVRNTPAVLTIELED
ncbi:MAG: phosphate/phosphite/phosphonate ABC transporter substrate-binding protein [Xenococcaceae cyanobacterium MO_188.B32]|nr:phosphate/phosphite/phosphonate ABC transporter substrate-binding protein [Xenococcaceae cyanobacterium MO_188.B32]